MEAGRWTARWDINGRPMATLLRAILPDLRRQRALAEVLIAFEDARRDAPHTTWATPLPPAHVARLDALWRQSVEINARLDEDAREAPSA